jgi:hypothetical protein
MSVYKCMDCGVDVPKDEAQLVNDMWDAKMKMAVGPLIEFIDTDLPYEEAGYCAACFRRHDAKVPVEGFVRGAILEALAQYLKDKTQQEEP